MRSRLGGGDDDEMGVVEILVGMAGAIAIFVGIALMIIILAGLWRLVIWALPLPI